MKEGCNNTKAHLSSLAPILQTLFNLTPLDEISLGGVRTGGSNYTEVCTGLWVGEGREQCDSPWSWLLRLLIDTSSIALLRALPFFFPFSSFLFSVDYFYLSYLFSSRWAAVVSLEWRGIGDIRGTSSHVFYPDILAVN